MLKLSISVYPATCNCFKMNLKLICKFINEVSHRLWLFFRTVTLWRNTRTPPSMSTLLVTSGFMDVMTAVVDGTSPSMAPSASPLGLLTVHSTCEQEQTIIFTVIDTLKVTVITFPKERCEWDSGLESASQTISLPTPTLVGIQWIVSSLTKYQKPSSSYRLVSCDQLDRFKKRISVVLCWKIKVDV